MKKSTSRFFRLWASSNLLTAGIAGIFTVFMLSFSLLFFSGCSPEPGQKVYVYAAASTTDVVTELIETYKKSTGSKAEIKPCFASSGNLARQIEKGAEADIFISANMKWYKYLEEKGITHTGSDFILAENGLVVIASPNAKSELKSPEELPALLKNSPLAMGDPSHVPAGKYAKEALEFHKIWAPLSSKKKIAMYPDVRKTLNAVETSQADFGIVYTTDAKKSSKAKIAYTFTGESHKAIKYPVCAIKDRDRGEAHAFLEYMKTEKAKEILSRYGFQVK